MNFNHVVFLCTLFFITFSFTQNTNPQNGSSDEVIDVKVVNETKFGNHFFYILQEVANENSFYKSSAVDDPVLQIGQEVKLADNNRTDRMLKVVQPTLPKVVYARKTDDPIENEVSDDFSEIRMPVLENNILFFEDKEHIDEVYDYFNDLSEDDSPGRNVPLEVRLEHFEREFSGFNSNRKLLYEKYGRPELSFSDEQMIQMEEEEVIPDVIFQTLFNEHRLIGIDCDVYYQHNYKDVMYVHKDNQEVINDMVNISKEYDYDIYSQESKFILNEAVHFAENGYNYVQRKVKPSYIKHDGVVYDFTHLGYIDPCSALIESKDTLDMDDEFTPKDSYWDIEQDVFHQSGINYSNDGHSCDDFKITIDLSVIREIRYSFHDSLKEHDDRLPLEGHQPFKITIDWGDGSSEEVFIGDYNDVRKRTHTYPDYDIYKVKTVAEYNFLGTYIKLDDSTSIDVTSNTFTSMEVSPRWRHIDQGNWRLRSKIWVVNTSFTDRKRFGTYTHSYKKNGSSWKRKRAKLYVYLEAPFLDKDCNYIDTKGGQKSLKNRKRRQITRSMASPNVTLRKTFNDQYPVNSLNQLVKGNTIIHSTLRLIVCD